jgi:bifunctional non-homologous end joining protein LigD
LFPGRQHLLSVHPHADLEPSQAAVAASLPRDIRPQIVSSCAEPPAGNDWLHEPKHDRHRLIMTLGAIGILKLLSRKGLDNTA